MATRFRSIGSRTPKRRRDRPPARTTFRNGLLISAVLLLVGWQALRLYNGLPTANYVKQYVSVPTVGNLLAHDFVRIGGKRVGQVYSVDVGNDGRPRVQLQLNPGTTLPKDTTVQVRANGLLGARYIQLLPGKSSENLPAGSTIHGDQTSYTNGLPETFEVFDQQTRGGLQNVITQLGGGFLDNGVPLNDTLKDLRYGTPKFKDLADTILARQGAAARFIPALDRGFSALTETDPYIKPGSKATQTALDPFVSERDAVRQSLTDFPSTFDAMRTGLPGGTRLLESVGNVSRALSETLPPAPAGFDALDRVFRVTPGPLKILKTATIPLRQAPRAPVYILNPVKPAFGQIKLLAENRIKPALAQVTRRSCDIKNFGAAMRSMTAFKQNGGGNGPLGAYKAFRLVLAVPHPVSALGLKDDTFTREGSGETPCKYLSQTYPQFQDPSTLLGNTKR